MPRFIATDEPQNIADGIVFYYSPMCPYCKSVLPYVNNIENMTSPDVPLYGVDVGGNPSKYGLKTVPALETRQNGKVKSGVYDSTLFEGYISRLCMNSRNNYMFCK